MADGWISTGTPGVWRGRLPVFADSRGSFTEFWRASLTAPLTNARFVQSNRSESRVNVLRGMHFHRRQCDLWVVSHGRAFVAATDLRAIESRGEASTETMELRAGDCIFLPELVAHGFLALEPMELIYFVTNEYDGTDELGFAWNDPDVGIDWPVRDPILSECDQANRLLRDVLSGS